MTLHCKLYTEDVIENEFKITGKPINVQRFDSNIYRAREEKGIPDGPSFAEVNFTVKLGETQNAREFYQKIKDFDRHPFSFLFNSGTKDGSILSDFRSGMVVWGYIAELEERFEVANEAGTSKPLTMLDIRLIVSRMTFIGSDGAHKSLSIFEA